MTERRLSVLLVAFHSRPDLERSLPVALRATRSLAPSEVLVVDNAPGDGTAEWIAATYPEVRVVAADENLGYAGGVDLGLRSARGEAVLFANPDVVFDEDAIGALLDGLAREPDALLNPVLLDRDGRVNAAGNVMHVSGITRRRLRGVPAEALTGPPVEAIPLLSGAAVMARRAALEALGPFDPRYVMYHEDTDLSLRARARGHKLLCVHAARGWHEDRFAVTPEKFFQLERNRLLTLTGNLDTAALRRLRPVLALAGLATLSFALLRRHGYPAAWMGARLDARRLRRDVASGARAPARLDLASYLAATEDALPFDQLMGNAAMARALDRVTTPLFHLLRPAGRPPRQGGRRVLRGGREA